jgi:hypothetical protein
MGILNSSIDWLRTSLQAHPVIWLAGTYLAGIVSGVLIVRRKKKA